VTDDLTLSRFLKDLPEDSYKDWPCLCIWCWSTDKIHTLEDCKVLQYIIKNIKPDTGNNA
jgi:hypothetical protein